jgi:hypothetical protein
MPVVIFMLFSSIVKDVRLPAWQSHHFADLQLNNRPVMPTKWNASTADPPVDDASDNEELSPLARTSQTIVARTHAQPSSGAALEVPGDVYVLIALYLHRARQRSRPSHTIWYAALTQIKYFHLTRLSPAVAAKINSRLDVFQALMKMRWNLRETKHALCRLFEELK